MLVIHKKTIKSDISVYAGKGEKVEGATAFPFGQKNSSFGGKISSLFSQTLVSTV